MIYYPIKHARGMRRTNGTNAAVNGHWAVAFPIEGAESVMLSLLVGGNKSGKDVWVSLTEDDLLMMLTLMRERRKTA